MSKIAHELKAHIDALTDEKLDRRVTHLKQTIPDLNAELDYAARVQRDRRNAALKKAREDALRNSR